MYKKIVIVIPYNPFSTQSMHNSSFKWYILYFVSMGNVTYQVFTLYNTEYSKWDLFHNWNAICQQETSERQWYAWIKNTY